MERSNDTENNTSEKSTNRRKTEVLKNTLSKFKSVFLSAFWTILLKLFKKN